ncbi:MAG TPA: dodecin family protein [Anaerolineales bacterium]|nr:dodecin family protein [Anaerolineales bacterium]
MSHHVYKQIELTGTSPDSLEDAIQTAVTRAGKTLRNLRWFNVTDIRGYIEGGQVAHWQVSLKLGFTLDDIDTTDEADTALLEPS